MITYDFSGQIAVVTGGTRGIGAAIAAALLRAGATVVATYAGNREAAEAFVRSQGEHQERLRTFGFDVSDYAAAADFFKEFDTLYPKLDILVSSAGIREDAVVPMMHAGVWSRVLDVNLNGAFNVAKPAVLRMIQRRYGRILFLTSPVGRIGFAGQANYAASKAGLVALAKSLSKEVARRNITVNCVSPGFIDTDFIGNLPEEQIKEYQAMVPLKRFGRPEEVAEAALFLLADSSRYITGTVLEVSGGL